MADLTVTLRRSIIGEKPKTVATVKGLGLGKLNSSNVLPDNPSVRGMLHKVRHLVEVEEIKSQESGVRKKKSNE
jgi:large subunit ribosomal protein L30